MAADSSVVVKDTSERIIDGALKRNIGVGEYLRFLLDLEAEHEGVMRLHADMLEKAGAEIERLKKEQIEIMNGAAALIKQQQDTIDNLTLLNEKLRADAETEIETETRMRLDMKSGEHGY